MTSLKFHCINLFPKIIFLCKMQRNYVKACEIFIFYDLPAGSKELKFFR